MTETDQNAAKDAPLPDVPAREAALRRILEIISTSRDDEMPVFDAILQSAAALCDAHMADLDLVDADGRHMREVATWGPSARATPSDRWVWPMDADFRHVEAVRSGEVVHDADIRDSDRYRAGHEMTRAAVDEEGVRAFLAVPLMADGRGIGAILLFRKEPRPFSAGEIALIETFAAQAVIAIENVRQFREVQERLERERASAQILEVISRSRNDTAPVFDAILQQAAKLCRAGMTGLAMPDSGRSIVRVVALHGEFRVFRPLETIFPMDADVGVVRAIRESCVIHRRDLSDIPDRAARKDMEDEGIRTILWVPLILDGAAIGCLGLFRLSREPYTEDEIALVETFAAQAVIAIENVRQFKALEALNAELGERVDEQVGEIERMGRLKRFLPPAVADAVVSSGSDKLLTSHRALIAVLFADIRGFTAFCESAEPEETIEVLQTYHEEMGKLIADSGAGVDTRAGDGIMVIFNDPLPCEDPAGDAARLAFAMRARMVELCAGWKRLGHRLGFGVGVSLGYATVGMVGAGGRFEYTASGTAVNLASRLCDSAEDGDILLSPRAFTALEDHIEWEPVGDMDFKGMRASVEVVRATAMCED